MLPKTGSNIDPHCLNAEDEHSLGRLMLQVYRSLHGMATDSYAARGHAGLTMGHTFLIAHVEPTGTRIGTLAERIGTTKQFAGRIVQELEVRGYLTTETDPTDRRATIVRVTEKGSNFLVDAFEAKREIEAKIQTALGDEQMEAFTSALEKLASLNAGQDLPPAMIEQVHNLHR